MYEACESHDGQKWYVVGRFVGLDQAQIAVENARDMGKLARVREQTPPTPNGVVELFNYVLDEISTAKRMRYLGWSPADILAATVRAEEMLRRAREIIAAEVMQ